MITNFLLNYEHELIEKKKELCKALKEKTLSIKQNEEFIRFIEMSEDNSYDLFAPQNFKNNINQERIRELNEKNIFLKESEESLGKEIQIIEDRLQEIEQLISSTKVYDVEEQEITDTVDQTITNLEAKLLNIKNKIQLCVEIIDIDKNRCKLELKNILSMINNILGKI